MTNDVGIIMIIQSADDHNPSSAQQDRPGVVRKTSPP
eukprot:CAMPEP_0174303646 /NCGR_PEP_ID=MMETSP0809-20121228/60307_1 /TAXON_ID=73025 ORGANISM="Eutreptiella gymnastica-like, Strain CCMP1594" /NCGR_SAMPLE_ID=MMETSP0809 /ASSEMBLY_ACC=CAM_ASM_000658 /LENGTH=36 /DNA_ID= /DNA_START= /DNA_END= /DNA_ORIENTATION=